MSVTSVLSASCPYRCATAFISAVALFGVPFVRPPNLARFWVALSKSTPNYFSLRGGLM